MEVNMKVTELMTQNYLSISPDTPLCEVQQLLVRYHLNDLVVRQNDND